jgi:membrane protein DedA with SNARE-associated domain
MAQWPVLAIYLFFLFGALARSQALYWLGRGVAAGVMRSRWAERLDSEAVHRAVHAIERWGMPIIPLAFLTVGFQSAVQSAAGLIRIGWLRYTLWTLPGALVWAAVWAGGGMAAMTGALALAARSPWALTGALLAVVGLVVVLVLRSRRRHEARSSIEALGLSAAGTRRTDFPPGPTAPPR